MAVESFLDLVGQVRSVLQFVFTLKNMNQRTWTKIDKKFLKNWLSSVCL